MSYADKPKHTSMTEILQETENMTPKQVSILEAAIGIIAEKGYFATSTNEIAKRAGVAEGTIFRHYRTKKDLLISIITPVITHFSAPVFAEKFVHDVFKQSHTRFEDFLYVFIKNRFEFAQANIPLLKILLQELAFHPEIQETYKRVFMEKVHPALINVLDFYKENSQLQNIPNERLIRLIVPTILGFLITRFIVQPTREWDDEAEIKQTIAYIMGGVGK